MTQQVVRCRVQFPIAIPEGIRPTFDMTFEQLGTATGIGSSEMDSLVSQIGLIFDGAPYSTAAYLPPNVRAGFMDFSFYDITSHLDGSPHGGPIYTKQYSLSNGGSSTPSPNELAIAVSFRSDYPAGSVETIGRGDHIRARHRGRMYFPIGHQALSVDATTGRVFFTHSFVDALAAKLPPIKAGSVSSDIRQVQWSRKDAAVYQIVQWWVDDEPDTRRKRGSVAQYRKVVLPS